MERIDLKSKKGAISLILVIFIFVITIFASGLMDIISKIYLINEVQGALDTAAVSALASGVNETKWRSEELYVDEYLVNSNFKSMIDDTFNLEADGTSKKSAGVLKRINIEYPLDIRKEENSLIGIDSTVKSRDQVFLVAVARVTYKSTPIFDKILQESYKYYDFFTGESDEVITFGSDPVSGESQIIVRTVARLTYR